MIQKVGRGTRTDDAKENLGLTESAALRTYNELLGYRGDVHEARIMHELS
jgi:hypothetical protein